MRTSFFLSTPRLIAVSALALSSAALHAQYENGGMVGTVRDASGAPVANATVSITNNATASTVQTTSNANGDYEVPSLRVGLYTVKATAPGFADTVANSITISVGERTRIDLGLKVGSVETVEVTGVAIQIETETSEHGQNITNYQSEALPLVSRNYSDLLGLVVGSRQAPTAATTSSINSLVRAGAYNVNGQRSMFNNFLLDGLDNNAYGESNQGFDNQTIAVPPDSVAQFQVVTNNESAEYGRSSGATINVATQSGSNKFHGTIYEFIRNTDLNSAGFFKPTVTGTLGNTPFQKPTFNRNQYGFNVSGPIIKDHLFFFLDYEGFRQVLKPLSVLTVPTLNELNGILTAPVKNPLTGKTYAAGTQIPVTDMNPLSRQIISVFRTIPNLPINGSSTTGVASNDYAKQVPFNDNADKGDLRLDYQQNASNSYFLRISDRKENGLNVAPLPLPLDGQSNGKIRVLDQQIALGYTHLMGANKVFDARLGLSRTKAGKYTTSLGNNSIVVPGLETVPAQLAGGLPAVSINGFTAFGRQTTNPQWQNPAFLDPKFNFTWVKGRHSMKFGYEYEHIWMGVNDNNPIYGGFSYAGGYSAVGTAVTDTYWADFLFGTTNSYNLANFFEAHLLQSNHGAYAQDDWKVSNKLTLNLGLRWEYGSPYSELHNNLSNFDPVSQTLLTITPGAVAGNGITPYNGPGGVYRDTLMNPDLNDFAPRIGFAFSPDTKMVMRGGFGTSYVHYTRAGSGDILAINAPQAQFVAVNQPTPSTTNHCATPLPLPGTTTATNCFATADQGFPKAIATTFNPATDNITYAPKDTRDSYVESYFIGVQRSLFKNTLIDISYVGNHGLKLQGFLNANQKNPSLGFARPYGNWPSDITEALNGFASNYNSLQVRYEQRFLAGLTLLNSFTWGHALDNATAALEANTPSPQDANNLKSEYAQSDYNLPLANVTSIVYELPFGRGRQFMNHSNFLTDGILGGWQLSLINTMQGGTPFNVTYSPSSTNSVSTQISATYRGANEYRPNRVPGQPLIKKSQLAGSGYIQYLNYAAFSLPATKDAAGNLLSPFGNLGRNPARNPAFYQTDLSLNKKFSTPVDNLKVEFRTEFYNILNHTNLYLPGGALGGTVATTTGTYGVGGSVPLSGLATAGTPTTGGQITSTFEPRVIQFGLKIIY